jgi:hypothetical protein
MTGAREPGTPPSKKAHWRTNRNRAATRMGKAHPAKP